MRVDHLMMLFPLGLEAPSPWATTGDDGGLLRDEAKPAPEPRPRRGLTLGLFLLCPFHTAVCSR